MCECLWRIGMLGFEVITHVIIDPIDNDVIDIKIRWDKEGAVMKFQMEAVGLFSALVKMAPRQSRMV